MLAGIIETATGILNALLQHGVTVALLSGVGLYLTRSKIRADRLRRAIAMEIRKTTPVGTFKTAILGPDALNTPIIDNNLDKIHLLKKDEVILIARYQSYMGNLRAYNDRKSADDTISVSTGLSMNASEIANNAADELEFNTWGFLTPIAWIRERVSRNGDGPGMTEEEIEEKREELIEEAKAHKEKAERESSTADTQD